MFTSSKALCVVCILGLSACASGGGGGSDAEDVYGDEARRLAQYQDMDPTPLDELPGGTGVYDGVGIIFVETSEDASFDAVGDARVTYHFDDGDVTARVRDIITGDNRSVDGALQMRDGEELSDIGFTGTVTGSLRVGGVTTDIDMDAAGSAVGDTGEGVVIYGDGTAEASDGSNGTAELVIVAER